MTDEVDEFLSNRTGICGPAFKWQTAGDTVAGVVTARRVVETEFGATLVVDLTSDDGTEWTVWVKRGQMESELANALKKNGARLQAGDRLAIKYVSDRPSKKAGYNPQRIYSVAYVPGTAAAAGGVTDVEDLV